MRKSPRVPETEPFDPDLAKVIATNAASHAMRSSGRSSTESKGSYDQIGGPGNVAIPRRRPNSGLQWTDDTLSTAAASMAPVTPRASAETSRAADTRSHILEESAILPPITEFKGLDGRDSSVPSSYRRIRKAKSMFSTRQRPSHVANDTPPLPHRGSCSPDRSPRIEFPRTLRHSVSFIRGANRQGSRMIRHAKSQDAAIQLARSQFLEDVDEVSPQLRRSSFFLYRRKREQKPFRKTFRVTSEGGGVDARSPSANPNSRSPYSKSRTFSASIKRGLKRVFGLSKPSEHSSDQPDESDSVIPAKAQLGDSHARELTDATVLDKTRPESVSLSVTQHSPGHGSLCTSTSRVTSWADSTVANTATTRKTGHHHSLSLIDEHGDLNRQPQVPMSNASNRQSQHSKRMGAHGLDGLVNSQDLYSALMQQMGRGNGRSPDKEITFGTVPEYRVIPERTSSVYSHRSRRTIRHVPSLESSGSPGSFATARGDSLTPQRHQRIIRYAPPVKASRGAPGQEYHRPSGGVSNSKSPRSAYVIGEESDEDTGSVIVARLGASKVREVSPTSVYSRSTGHNTPTENFNSCGGDVLEAEEPGTVTIFESQRSTYSSPTRTDGPVSSKNQVQPSADWKQWMSSQIERIEKASPIRHHVRENAQMHDDGLFTGVIPLATGVAPELTALDQGDEDQEEGEPHPLETKPWIQNSFSRPFSRSSSVRTILSSQKIEPVNTTNNGAPDPDPAVPVGRAVDAPFMAELSPSDVSPMRMRSANLLQIPESPTPHRSNAELQKRARTQEQWRRYSARRPNASGTANQFRSMRTHRDFRGVNNENTKQQEEHDDMMNEYHKLHDAPSTVSSKHMVEMFLNSRRRPAETRPSVNTADEAFL